MTLNNEDEKKKSLIRKLLTMKRSSGRKVAKDSYDGSELEEQIDSELKGLFCCRTQTSMLVGHDVNPVSVFVGTWNVGGNPPRQGLDLDDFIRVHDESDIYILGFQEIVPLNAGNVLVLEDNEPAVNWLDLVNQSLNKSPDFCILNRAPYVPETKPVSRKSSKSTSSSVSSSSSSSKFFQKPSLRKFSKKFRTESKRRLKSCNCNIELERKNSKESCFNCQQTNISENDYSSEEEDGLSGFGGDDASMPSGSNQMKYGLVVSKQMVGIFVTIWVRTELVQHVGHLRISCISRGIMGYLGNKGCISVSMTYNRTSFCFVCSHLASGEREGDELRRNSDVMEILKNTQFPKICKTSNNWVPDRILDHDRVIWFGDLNYRIALSYSDTRKLLDKKDWSALLKSDQLKIELESGRVFKGWKEGKIFFAPTYKYSYNSDVYAGETIKSKDKRRTPAWCDRILWHGNGIKQLSYLRGESRFSDHRPVCASFFIDV